MLDANEGCTTFSIDTGNQSQILAIEKTNAWNPRQGTMFPWHAAGAMQVFFNDGDAEI